MKKLTVKHLPGDISLPKTGQEVCMLKRRAAREDPVLPELTPGSRKTQICEDIHLSQNTSSCSYIVTSGNSLESYVLRPRQH